MTPCKVQPPTPAGHPAPAPPVTKPRAQGGAHPYRNGMDTAASSLLPPSAAPGRPALRLARLSVAGLLLYAVPMLLAPPAVTPEMLVSGDFSGINLSPLTGALQSGGALLYASALLPLVVLYGVAEIRSRPVTTAVIASALGVSTLIQILSYLPTLALQLHPVPPLPPELARALGPSNWIRFVALDIAGFSIAYVAGGVLAWLYRRRSPLAAWAYLAGIAVFCLHLPILPFAPRLAGALMAASICLCIGLPLLLATLVAPVTSAASLRS